MPSDGRVTAALLPSISEFAAPESTSAFCSACALQPCRRSLSTSWVHRFRSKAACSACAHFTSRVPHFFKCFAPTAVTCRAFSIPAPSLGFCPSELVLAMSRTPFRLAVPFFPLVRMTSPHRVAAILVIHLKAWIRLPHRKFPMPHQQFRLLLQVACRPHCCGWFYAQQKKSLLPGLHESQNRVLRFLPTLLSISAPPNPQKQNLHPPLRFWLFAHLLAPVRHPFSQLIPFTPHGFTHRLRDRPMHLDSRVLAHDERVVGNNSAPVARHLPCLPQPFHRLSSTRISLGILALQGLPSSTLRRISPVAPFSRLAVPQRPWPTSQGIYRWAIQPQLRCQSRLFPPELCALVQLPVLQCLSQPLMDHIAVVFRVRCVGRCRLAVHRFCLFMLVFKANTRASSCCFLCT